MSVFDQKPEGQATEQPVQAEATPTTESFVAKLVAERGEQWSDPEAIAKGKIEADAHISNLEAQLAEMRADLEKRDYTKELLEQVQNKAGAATPTTDTSANEMAQAADQNTTGQAPDIDSLVEEALKRKEAKQTAEQNIASVDAALTEAYGTDAAKVVADKAAELGMGLDRLQAIASESPSAFLRLVGDVQMAPAPSAPKSSVNTTSESFSGNSAKNFGYYQQMRRDNPTQYYTPAMQREMIASRDKLGGAFFNS